MTTTAHNEMVDLPDSFAGLANLIVTAITKVAAMPLGLASDADLLAGMEVLERAWRRADGANAAVLMEISDRSVYTKAGCRSMKKFLAEHHRLGNAEANRRLTTAAAIGRFTATTGEKLPPKREPVATGVAEGTISGEHVHEIELVMTKVPHSSPPDDVELAMQILSEAATELAPADLRKVGQRLLAHLDPDGSLTDEKDRRRMRGISIGPQDKQLMSKISGYITPTLRAKMEVLLDNWAKPGMNNPDDENPLVGAVAELSDKDRERLTEAIRTDQRTAAQRNHDAFERGLDWVLGHEALGQPKRLPVHVVITVEERDLARNSGVGLTATGTRVPVGDLVGLAAGAVPWLAVFADFTRKNPVTDAEVQAEYDKYKGQSGGTEYRARHILVEKEDEAKALIGQIKGGQLVPLAVGSPRRATALPDVPTTAEAGYPKVDATSWFAVFAPAGVSKAVVDKLTADIRTVVQSPTFQQKAQEQGATADYQTPAQLGDKVRADLANWATVVKTSKIEAE